MDPTEQQPESRPKNAIPYPDQKPDRFCDGFWNHRLSVIPCLSIIVLPDESNFEANRECSALLQECLANSGHH
jgi:hypothetical protein